MNYDTILPEKIRTRLERKSAKKPLKLVYKIAIALLLLAGLRHFNTVPHREWSKKNYTGTFVPNDGHETLVYTAEELFGSSYRVKKDGQDIGITSRNFGDVFLQAFGSNSETRLTLRAIDP
jgi:hypothetical protein